MCLAGAPDGALNSVEIEAQAAASLANPDRVQFLRVRVDPTAVDAQSAGKGPRIDQPYRSGRAATSLSAIDLAGDVAFEAALDHSCTPSND